MSFVPAAQAANVTWTDATEAVGLDNYGHAGEVHGDPLEVGAADVGGPEIIGSGACFADFDGDGYDDLYIVNQQYNPDNEYTEGWIESVDPTGHYYANNGDGTFTDRTVEAGLESRRFGYGCSVADYDADGDVDLYVSNFGDDRFGGSELYRNNGDGTFAEVGKLAGLDMSGACGDHPCMTTSSGWADYDLDGDVDLYAGNYVHTNLSDLVHGPGMHVAQPNWLFRNNGDGTFAEVAEAAGVKGNETDVGGSKTLGVVWFDSELDGDLDLYVANDQTPNDFYVNNGDGTFLDRSNESHLDNDRASMGVTSGDYDNDGFFDLYFTHHVRQENGFYRNLGNNEFEDRSGEDDLHEGYDWRVGWGTHFVDYDRDMDLDLIAVNGHTGYSDEIASQTAQVFRNDPEVDPQDPGDRLWVDVTNESGEGVTSPKGARGAAFADYDLDGDTDFLRVCNNNQTLMFSRGADVTNHWLYVSLRQTGPNPLGVGARVQVEAGGVRQHREVQAGSSYLSQNSLNLEFGLGEHTLADRVIVHWLGGGTTIVEDIEADQVVRIDRELGVAVRDTLSPLTRALPETPTGVDGWMPGPARIAIVAEDRGVSERTGVAQTQFSVDGGAWVVHDAQDVEFDTDGTHAVRAWSQDAQGNREPVRTYTFKVDSVPPVSTATVEGVAGAGGWWVSDDVTVTLGATDDRSGVHTLRFRVNEQGWADYVGPVTIRGDGVYRLEVQATDRAGNAEAIQTTWVRLDHIPPEVELLRPRPGSVYYSNGETTTSQLSPAALIVLPGSTFFVIADGDDATSGMARVGIQLDGTFVDIDDRRPYLWVWPIGESEPGKHVLGIQTEDFAGIQAARILEVVVVKTAPDPASGDLGLVGLAALAGLTLPRRRRGR